MTHDQSIDHSALWDDAVSTAAAKKEAGLGGGLTPQSVAVLQRVRLSTGGIMTRAAQGDIGAGVKTRRLLNLTVLLDCSGSMENKRAAVVDGLNHLFSELADENKSPQRHSIYVTVWLFRNTSADLMTVNGPNGPMELSNVLVTQMPRISMSDYKTHGMTPMNKTILTALGAGSLRAQRLSNARKGSMNYLLCISDGEDNLKEEIVGGKKVTYYDKDVADVARDLLASEDWILGFAYVGGGKAKQFADAIGFPLYRDIADNQKSWREFFSFVSQSVRTTSTAVGSASQIVSDNAASFF